MLIYKTDVLARLKKAGYNSTRIHNEHILPDGTMQKLRTGEMIGTKTLDKLCELLIVQPNSIIKYVPDLTEVIE